MTRGSISEGIGMLGFREPPHKPPRTGDLWIFSRKDFRLVILGWLKIFVGRPDRHSLLCALRHCWEDLDQMTAQVTCEVEVVTGKRRGGKGTKVHRLCLLGRLNSHSSQFFGRSGSNRKF